MPILVNKYLIGRHFVGVAVWPLIIVKNRSLTKDMIFINHEKIHLRQQRELLVIPFYFFYFFEYLIRLIQYKNFGVAYRNISFEREAYHNEDNLEYLNERTFWSFLKYR
ncbi:hypothetical protein ACE939_15535 [Aquimarina sp. W85]|uniref:hypothetical protein n=1 Tax=Aquimarina rhodophyticola TaxID=3342246 RepID=UPI00366A7C37